MWTSKIAFFFFLRERGRGKKRMIPARWQLPIFNRPYVSSVAWWSESLTLLMIWVLIALTFMFPSIEFIVGPAPPKPLPCKVVSGFPVYPPCRWALGWAGRANPEHSVQDFSTGGFWTEQSVEGLFGCPVSHRASVPSACPGWLAPVFSCSAAFPLYLS